MKRLIYLFFTAGIFCMLCLITACKKDVLPQPAFPLKEEVITAAIEKTGLPGKISESETTSYGEGHILHVVRSLADTYSDTVSPEEAQANPGSRVLIAGIDSVITEGERQLSIIFDQKEVSEAFAWEDWKQQIVFTALLYGGFENEEDIYQAFYGKEFPEGEDSYQWDAQLPDAYCRVRYDSRKIHTVFDEYGIPGKRQSGTMRVKIYESQELWQKEQDAYIKERTVK